MSNEIISAKEINTIVAATMAADFVIGDDHNGGKGKLAVSAVALFKRYDDNGQLVASEVVPLFDWTAHCINPLYLSEGGEVRLSTWSWWGNVDPRGISLEQAVEKFNNFNWFVGRQTLEILARKGQKEVA